MRERPKARQLETTEEDARGHQQIFRRNFAPKAHGEVTLLQAVCIFVRMELSNHRVDY